MQLCPLDRHTDRQNCYINIARQHIDARQCRKLSCNKSASISSIKNDTNCEIGVECSQTLVAALPSFTPVTETVATNLIACTNDVNFLSLSLPSYPSDRRSRRQIFSIRLDMSPVRCTAVLTFSLLSGILFDATHPHVHVHIGFVGLKPLSPQTLAPNEVKRIINEDIMIFKNCANARYYPRVYLGMCISILRKKIENLWEGKKLDFHLCNNRGFI